MNNQKTLPKERYLSFEPEFRHRISIGRDGEILYDCPIEIADQKDLENYGITWRDCRVLNFHGSDKVTVYFFKTRNRALAEYQWSYLDSKHSRENASKRCMVPGKRKPFIRCRDTFPCDKCPYLSVRISPVESLEARMETGWEPLAKDSVDREVFSKLEYKDIKTVMDEEDIRIAQAFEMKELLGYSAAEIAERLKISQPRVYQLVARAKAIGREFRKSNE